MSEALRKLISLFLKNKGKFVLMLVSALVFSVVLFPFGDLSDLITAQVSKATGNQLYLQFDKMRLSLIPSPGVEMESVLVETRGFPPLSTDELVLSPSLKTLITQKPAGTISAKGFLRGDLDLSMQPGSKSDNGVERQEITINAKSLNLSELRSLLQLPVALRGQVNLSSKALADLALREQPDVDVSLKVDRFELPTSNVNTMMGPLTLPEIKLASVELKGRLSAGKFIIETGVIGKNSDEVYGTIKGNIGLTLQKQGNNVAPIMGSYNFDVNLNVRKSFQEKANLFLTFVDNYKTPTADGAEYKFKVSAGSPQVPPSISALR